MTAAAPSAQRSEASRRNGRQSKGPSSPQGRIRSSQNALKHGLTARTVVLPGEDPDALQARVDAWKADLRPTDEVQDYLIERAAHASRQLDRADRTMAARLTAIIRAAPADRARQEAEEVADLGRRLFWDPVGPAALYPHVRPDSGQPTISWSGALDDPLDPALIVARLEATAAGCRWLLDRWAELRAFLEDDGRNWQGPDRFRATRLLGRQPLEALDDGRVMMIHLACRAMEPGGAPAFADLKPELTWYAEEHFAARAEGRGAEARTPADPAAGRAALLAIVEQAVTLLEALLGRHRGSAAAEPAFDFDALAFDDSPEGERLRRYHVSAARTFYRAVDTIFRARREADRRAAEGESAEPPGGEAPASLLAALVETNPRPAEAPISSPAAPVETNPIALDVPAPGALGETNPSTLAGSPPAANDETNPTAPAAPAPSPGALVETNPTAAPSARREGTAQRSEATDPAPRRREAAAPQRGEATDPAPHPQAAGPLPPGRPSHLDEVRRALAERRAALGTAPAPAPRPAGETNPSPGPPTPGPAGRRTPPPGVRPEAWELAVRMQAELDRRAAAGEPFPTGLRPSAIFAALAQPPPR